MSPREITFNRQAVLDAAVSLVREEGWERLTARRIADRLKASVAPVYSAFGSMDVLERDVLEDARRRLNDFTARTFTGTPFLNIGVGMVAFAKEEANLFRALFHTRHSYPEIIDAIHSSILERMKADPTLRVLSDESLARLLNNLSLFTIGLATSIVFERAREASTKNIIRWMKDAGNIMIYAEVSGIADSDSPENERRWTSLLKEKKIAVPETKPPSFPPATTRRSARPRKKRNSRRYAKTTDIKETP